MFVAKPELTKVVASERCASHRRAQEEARCASQGHSLDAVVKVLFQGSYGHGDDTVAPVRPGSSSTASVKVPIGAVSGPLTAW